MGYGKSLDVVRLVDEKIAREKEQSSRKSEAFELGSDTLLTFDEADKILMNNERFSYFVHEHNAANLPSEIIKDLRRATGWSQARLAKRLKISQARISVMESGDAKEGPSLNTLARVAEACGHRLRVVIHFKTEDAE